MLENVEYTLCGGTFLSLILHARKQRTAARTSVTGKRDGLNDSDVFEGLLRVAFPNYISPIGKSIRTFTSSYKSCKLSANIYLPFDKKEWINAFDHEIKNSFSSPLRRMCEFTSAFIDERSMGRWLVCAILDTISRDTSITDELFYMDNSGQPIDKNHLLLSQSIDLQSFLLGIWHFILLNRHDNTVGVETYDAWHKQPTALRARREFTAEVGKNWKQSINVNIISAFDSVSKNNGRKNPHGIPSDETAVLLSDSVSSELTKDTPWKIVPKDLLPSGDVFSVYLENAYSKYNKMKTLLYNDAPRKFYDFYVCNDILQTVYIKKSNVKTRVISKATAQILQTGSNFILISGTGGLGKSMMMRHLLLDAINRFDDYCKIPVFIPLKDYDDSYDELLGYIFEKVESLGGFDSIDVFSELLDQGSCLLLFDGLDEIKSDYRKHFERGLDIFADKYTDNMYVISSRPTGSFISLHRFTVLDLCPFNKSQALELIDKLDFRPDEPTIKKNFRKELEMTLYYSHREFTQNPLLLTIMLMTYEQFAEVPSKMHVFYREAYAALSQKHDASKGAYKRVLKTGLTADQFSDFFAEFCARSYRDEKFEFTEVLFDQYFNSLRERTKTLEVITATDFRDDLVENMCLMFYESGKYHFTHRSFQEYFCALFFSKQKDKTLKAIGDFFENKKSRNYTDKTFNMLYDMIPEKVEEYIFEPFLRNLFEMCDMEDGYWTFLQKMYPILYYEYGETDDYAYNTPESFIYNSIIRIQGFYAILSDDTLPPDDEFVTTEWVYLDSDYQNPDFDPQTLVDLKDVPLEYIDYYGDPEIVGRNYEIHIADILKSTYRYQDLLCLLENDDFPLKAEYLAVRIYLQELIDRHDIVGDDFFDLFQ